VSTADTNGARHAAAGGSGQLHGRLEPVLASPTPSANLLEQASVDGSHAGPAGARNSRHKNL